MRIIVFLLSVLILANPVFAKNNKKIPLECVPSPNPDVPPCDLDQTPLTPSDIAKKTKENAEKKDDTEATRTSRKKPSTPRSNKGGY